MSHRTTTALFFLGLWAVGCVPTADFTELRDEVRDLQAENKKLKQSEAEFRRRFDSPDRNQLPPAAAARLDALEASIGDLKTRQQGLDKKVTALITQVEDVSRQLDAQSNRPDDTSSKPLTKGGGKAPPSTGFETQAVLTPTASFNLAYNDYLKGNYDLAIAGFESFLRQFPSTSLAAHAQYWIGESYSNKREYRSAIDAYEHLVSNYPKSDKVPSALYKAASGYVELGDFARARNLFKHILEEHPQSDEAGRAKQRLADLK
jgi:tol-pal system protein YbgF